MKIFKYQLWHFLIVSILLSGIYFYVKIDSSVLEGELFGIETSTWFLLAILSPIFHQIYVFVCWRIELYYSSFSKTFGDKGFYVFKIGFGILIISRLVTLILLAFSSRNTFHANNIFIFVVVGILLILSLYLFYSVKKYFGINRAFGLDHFKPEALRSEPFVREGIFKYTSNGMYVYGFLVLYVPGLLLQSKAALLVALFSHIYIWVHYYFTELPDIKLIYKKDI